MIISNLNEISVSEWETPASRYPISQVGRAAIRRRPQRRGYYLCHGQAPPGDPQHYGIYRARKSLPVTSLLINRQVWMVDDPPHYWSIQRHALAYSGRVICAGLGLGLIVHALADNPRVSEILVVECSPDVIGLVGPLLPRRQPVRLIRADWHEAGWRADLPPIDGVFYDLFLGDMDEGHVMEAAVVMNNLRADFPGAVHRILGFDNEVIQGLADRLGADRLNYLKSAYA